MAPHCIVNQETGALAERDSLSYLTRYKGNNEHQARKKKKKEHLGCTVNNRFSNINNNKELLEVIHGALPF